MGDLPTTNGHGPQSDSNGSSTNFTVKAGLAKMLKGGVIMDVVNAEQVGTVLHIRYRAGGWKAAADLDILGTHSRGSWCLRRHGT